MNEYATLFTLGAWSLQKDTIWSSNKQIASIRHQPPGPSNARGHVIWFNDKSSISMCYCGAVVPDVIQGLCVLYNMEWLQETNNER